MANRDAGGGLGGDSGGDGGALGGGPVGGLGGGPGDGSGGGPRIRLTLRLLLWGAAALVGIVLMAQNTDQTRVRVFGLTVDMPLFLLIAFAMVIGWLLGALGWWVFRRNKTGR